MGQVSGRARALALDAAFVAIQSPPVGYAYADGQYRDVTSYALPLSAHTAIVDLFYQTTSKEYVEFLRDQNTTNSAGDDMHAAWVANGRAAPVAMAGDSVRFGNVAVVDHGRAPSLDLRVGTNPFRGTLDLQVAVTRDARVVLGTTGARRSYDETFTGLAYLPLRSSGWRAGTNATFRVTPAVSVLGSYGIDIGPGASSSDGDAAVQWQRPNGTRVALRGTAFQNVGEYQIGDGTVFGVGAESAMRVMPGLQLVGGLFVYRHTSHDQPQLVNWHQRRASVRLEWTLGSEPSWGGAIGRARASMVALGCSPNGPSMTMRMVRRKW